MFLEIKEVARELGVATVTLRRWEKEGNTPPILRSATGRRKYSLADIKTIKKFILERYPKRKE